MDRTSSARPVAGEHGPRVEVLRGCVVVTPGCGPDRRVVQRELAYRLRQAGRSARVWAYPSVNVIPGDDLFIPDLAMLRTPGGGRTAIDISSAVLLGEIVSPADHRSGVIDRRREYAAAGVPFFLRVDLRNRVPALALHELVEGEYQALSAAAAGTTFVMRQPFEFSVDPADLLDEEAPSVEPDTAE
ncbi:Uma2 family endonuclease [Micromonospora sp. NBC_00898]|uniref:Uma2 family endonuclease n=1 Tax=Micromonospora sp. NBC_00898 TaxID=2975981 RepID=UPI00386F9D27|nr:Uma2 family endonuclease [Micromonospora sp. NBC_00898]